jgi:hypothetical protein
MMKCLLSLLQSQHQILWTVVTLSFKRLLFACRYMILRTKCTQRLSSCCRMWQCQTRNTTSRRSRRWSHCCQWQSTSTSHTMGHSPHRPVWKWSPGSNSSNPSYCPTARSVISCGSVHLCAAAGGTCKFKYSHYSCSEKKELWYTLGKGNH